MPGLGRTCRKCKLRIELIGGAWVVMGTGTTGDGMSCCPPDSDARKVGEHQPAAGRYRAHVHDAGNGHWLASQDFPVRPDLAAANAAFEELRGPGWFEVRVHRLHGQDELALAAWTQENGTLGRKS